MIQILGLWGLFCTLAMGADRPSSFFFVVVSDSHVYARGEGDPSGQHPVYGRDTAGDWQRVIEEINVMDPAPAFIVHTGDMVHDATVEQFTRFREALDPLDPDIPVHLCLGNHDAHRDAYAVVFPDHKPYYTFLHGPWRFWVLDTRSQGYFDKEQLEWLAAESSVEHTGPAMVFLHYPLMEEYEEDDPRSLRAAIFPLLASASARWVWAGHWHRNVLARLQVDGWPEVWQGVTTAATGTFGYENPGYRMVYVEGDRVTRILFKRLGGLDVRTEPAVVEWPLHRYPGLSDDPAPLLWAEPPEDESLIHYAEGVGFNAQGFRFVDGHGRLVYRVPLKDLRSRHPGPVALELSIGSDYRVGISGGGNDYVEHFRTEGREGKSTKIWPIPTDWASDDLYIQIQDATPEDGMGAFVYAVRIVPLNQESPYEVIP